MNRKTKKPYATIAFAIINVLVFLLLDRMGNVYDAQFMANYGADNWQLVFQEHEYWRLVSSMFLHFGFEHLAGNMLMLIVAGMYVEKDLGTVKFAICYLLSGIGASIVSCVHYMIMNDVSSVSAGASGAIFGIMGAMVAIELKDRKLVGNMVWQRAAVILILMVIDGYSSQGVDYIAHLGGLIFGFIITLILYKGVRKRKLRIV